MSEERYEGIAIVGLSGRFPGADSVEEFWSNLVAGVESISFFSDAELAESGLDPVALRKQGTYVPARGILRDGECFDAGFFGIHPKEAEVLDPQHRVFLEACWEGLERAGYAPSEIPCSVGVFGGATYNTYYEHILQRRPDLKELMGAELVMFGNEVDYLTTRVAYKLGLRGPALNVSTACSTSMVAVCQACHSLLTYQCDMALAGGVSVKVPQKSGYRFEEGYIGSPDGHTRTFDAAGAGTVFSNGVGVVVLKRLEEAVKDGDLIYAVIKGAAVNNDGSQRVSFGAPGVEGQAEVIATAHALAGVDPSTITYVEAHGTATPLGDPIEVAGLTKAFRYGTDAKQFCALGSVKTNVGHMDAAAGVTGLIKTALSLYHKTLPPSLHFQSPNPKMDLANGPFYVNASLKAWESPAGTPRRAGVSSFGSGGTNAHVVLEEAPVLPASSPSRPAQLLTLSAKTPEALERATLNLAGYLEQLSGGPDSGSADRQLADAAFTLKTGRSGFVHRRIVAGRDAADVANALRSMDAKRVFTHRQESREAPVAFLFPGQGAQYAGMGAELYRTEPVFSREVDRCAEIVRPLLPTDLRELMFAQGESASGANALLTETRFTQPALFVIEYALARLWMSWGVTPRAMIGHSIGEYVAGCLSGVFSLEDALLLVANRAALVQQQPPGGMLAIRLPEEEVTRLLNEQLSIAAINSASLCVVSGPHDAIKGIEAAMASRGVATRLLHTSHAFHSQMMEPVLAPFTELLRKVKFGEPQIPFVSNVTGEWVTVGEATSPEYWADHVRRAVRFADGVARLMDDGRQILLEVGPGQTLATLARAHAAKPAEQAVFSSMPLTAPHEARGLMETLGRIWMTGAEIKWDGFYEFEQRRKCVLPTYPFERKRFWPVPNEEIHAAIPDQPVIAAAIAAPTAAAAAIPATAAAPVVDLNISREDHLIAQLRVLLEELSGYDFSDADPSMDLLELGLDSLLLTQAAQLLQRRFGVTVSFRQLMEELSSIRAIAVHLDGVLPAGAFVPVVAAPVQPMPVAPALAAGSMSGAVPQNVLEQILQQQQQLTNQLLQLMGQPPAAPVTPRAVVATPPAVAKPVLTIKSEMKSHGPFKPIDRAAGLTLSEEQNRFLQELIVRYTRRTARSKQLAAENRPLLADPRSAAGFKQLWKEMVYPIVTVRSDASRVWDVDGNEYIDFVMGFGASLFGHRPPFVVKAVHEQLDLGFEIGPIQPLAYEVAALMREFTGMERVGFTNTGSEAVLAATRVARTVSGRDKIAVFAGAYHGIFDEVLFRPLVVNGETRTAPIAPGIAQSAISEVIVLDYGNPQSLEIIRARGAEIAAVLVEPVQSRRLDLQPREFLHELRKVTEQTGSALIFDEVVTGFRVNPGGSQAHFGVRADLATYGKVMGGGISIGVVAGSPKYMDALDGGKWNYGDNSFPEVGVTFFAGTFVRHPLALAAAKAVLLHLKKEGPELQQRLGARTARLADDLRAVFEEFNAPYVLTQFSSLIQVGYPADQKFAGLFFYILREKGIHIWENRAFVITTAHTEDDFSRLVAAFREVLTELRAGGFLPPGSGSGTPDSKPAARSQDELSQPVERSRKVVAAPSQPAGSSARSTGSFPLTEAQKEIWLAAQMGGDAGVGYNESLKLEFRGAFECDLFRAAIRQIVERHPIVTASISEDGLSQHVAEGVQIDVPLVDLSGESESERQTSLAAIFESAVSEPFDLTVGPLLRIKIVRLSGDHHVVIWTTHHIICDGWSAGLLISEIAAIYSGLKRGIPASLEAPASFKEYALSTQGDSSSATQDLAYWQSQFNTIPAPLELPTDHSRPSVRSARAATAKREIDATTAQTLKRTAGRQRTTMVVILMAGLKTMLYRFTGQTDLVIGLGAAGQATAENSCLVGHCVNLLPIRTDLVPASSFQDNLAAVKTSVLNAFDHHHTTIGAILQHLKVRRTTSRPPLVEVIFNVDRDAGGAQFEGVSFACERNPKRALHYDLFFNFTEGAAGLKLECDYNTDLFEAATIERWLSHYQTLLEGIIAHPEMPLSDLPLLTTEERDHIVRDWNNTTVKCSGRKTLQEWIEHQAEDTPDALAVSFEGRALTYRELNLQANRVANYLMKRGVKSGSLVGVYLERSNDLVVAVLGILKAGAAYVPMDPVYPKDRLGYILEDSQAVVVVTQSSIASSLPGFAGETILLDQDRQRIQAEAELKPFVEVDSHDLAYVLFTSGSTGRPKGVAIEHGSAVTFVEWAKRVFTAEDLAGVLFSTSICFDLSVFEIFVTLSSGGTVIITPNALHLPNLAEKNKVTLINTVPSALSELIQMGGIPANVKVVNLAGEALPERLVEQAYAKTGVERIYNLYGPTEATTYSTYTLVPKGGEVTIGRPIDNTQCYILDQNRRAVPVGVPGELFIGGAGVARGYLNRPDLTAQRFSPDAFSGDADARLYATGDLARYRADGVMEYLGRIDNQVKLRGFRIELGEIEAVLGGHPAVKTAVVSVREDRAGSKQLVGYLVPLNSKRVPADELRGFVKKTLPDYMVPAIFVWLDSLPLSANGKIDRKALPAPASAAGKDEKTVLAARDEIEQILTRIWVNVLKVKDVGIHDNFFELGGHSLLAVRIIGQIEKAFGKRLPLATLVRTPTVAGLAEILRKENWQPTWASLVPIQSAGSKPPLFLFHSHGGNVLEYYPLASYLGKSQPVYGLQARGLDGRIAADQSIEGIAAAYLTEIRSVQPEGPYYLGGFCFGGLVAWEASQQLAAAGEEVALLVLIQTTQPRLSVVAAAANPWWHRAMKRVDLELEFLKHKGLDHARERFRRFRDVTKARTEMSASRNGTGNRTSYEGCSLPVILEVLGVEHDRAFERYVPRAYAGKTVLFRASKQLYALESEKHLGWAELSSNLTVSEVPGHQQTMLMDPNVEVLAQQLATSLRTAHVKAETAPTTTADMSPIPDHAVAIGG